MRLCVALDDWIFKSMLQLPLNNEALKQFMNCFGTVSNIYNKQFITLVVQIGGDISLSHVYFHLPSAREDTYVCWCNISPYCTLTHAIRVIYGYTYV